MVKLYDTSDLDHSNANVVRVIKMISMDVMDS
jgi:hypothetical protein